MRLSYDVSKAMENKHCEIVAFGEGEYIPSRRLIIRLGGDCYYLTIQTPEYAEMNARLGCHLEELKSIGEGGSRVFLDAKGFFLRFFVEGAVLTIDYQGDIEQDPGLRFCAAFRLEDFKAAIARLAG